MPDVWTTNPEKLRNFLNECGARCGIESRVLKPRDPEWTCGYDSKGWVRDVYIHPVTELYYFWPMVLVAAIVGIFIGLLWGKRFWRNERV